MRAMFRRLGEFRGPVAPVGILAFALGFVLFFSNNGAANRALAALLGTSEPPLRILYSFPAILLAHAFYNFAVLFSRHGS